MKHIPLRTCVGCRGNAPKKSLIRIVATPEGILIDPSGKTNGRGAYLHPDRSCWESGIKGPLSKALKIQLTDKDKKLLTDYIEKLPVLDQN